MSVGRSLGGVREARLSVMSCDAHGVRSLARWLLGGSYDTLAPASHTLASRATRRVVFRHYCSVHYDFYSASRHSRKVGKDNGIKILISARVSLPSLWL